ncbi:MAG: hypothetical protein MUP03_03175 [Anaerolineales bacterium]|nr:hypothetical protein [Anaerolineales bacterium]
MFIINNIIVSILDKKNLYLDPGSGSFLLQLLIAGLLGLGIALRASWGKIRKMFGKGQAEDNISEDDNDE